MDKKIQNVFLKRKLMYTIVLAVVLGIYIVSSLVTEFHLTEGVASFPKAFAWIAENLIPDEMAMKRFPKILNKLMETALLSVAVTVIATVFAFFFIAC